MVNILVTAVGCELAFSVIKAIKLLKYPYKLIGCDVYQEVVGKYWVDKFYQVTFAKNEDDYIKEIKHIIDKENIEIIIPTADVEILILSKYKNEFIEQFSCNILVNDNNNISLFNNKWLAHEWFESNNIPNPKTYILNKKTINENCNELIFPIIIKPNFGGGSRGIKVINNIKELKKYSSYENFIFQEYLYPDDEEYTAGTFRSKENKVYSIILKRSLKFGMTNKAKVYINKHLERFCEDIILKSTLQGSNNIQFRLTNDGPKVLEINPRFSGTTGIRALFGFNDVDMWISNVLNKEFLFPKITKGFVLRYMEDQIHYEK